MLLGGLVNPRVDAAEYFLVSGGRYCKVHEDEISQPALEEA
jgi:hypothetical protein